MHITNCPFLIVVFIIAKEKENIIKPLYNGNPPGTLVNSEDPDEMPHKAAFHQGLHFLPKIKRSLEKFNFKLEIILVCLI